MVDYEETDQITPLPCSNLHYFHTQCIERWMTEKHECPLCRKEFNPEELETFRQSFM